jgi:FAD:protein FMN transferase
MNGERVVRVERLMGTVVTIDVRHAASPGIDSAIDGVIDELRRIEAVFSPWRPDSEISRLADDRLAESEASPDARFVLAACDHLAEISGGAFDARRHREDGRLDPSGFVKGWAVEEAARHLDDAGLTDFAINAGGDILVRGDGEPGSGQGWRVGIRDPQDESRVVSVVHVRGFAVATSGLYERGAHIRDPRAASQPRHLPESITVVGPSLAWADAYATAAFVIGPDGLAWLDQRPGYAGMAIWPDRRLAWTAALDPLLPRRERADSHECLTRRR